MPAPERQTARVQRFIPFTADDYRDIAQACRVAAVQAENDAKKQSNPSTVQRFLKNAEHFHELAKKAELAARVV